LVIENNLRYFVCTFDINNVKKLSYSFVNMTDILEEDNSGVDINDNVDPEISAVLERDDVPDDVMKLLQSQILEKKRMEKHIYTLSEISRVFINASVNGTDYREVLGILGEEVKADRIVVVEFDDDEGKMKRVFEWDKSGPKERGKL
jgi:hypothetical protein